MADEPTDSERDQPEREADVSEGPLVFVSHDSRDAAVAEAFCKLLSNVCAGMLQTFRSSDRKGSDGFEYGVEWYPELMKRLEAACDVVCLLTERSLDRPWLLYEAGVAKGKLNVPVHGLVLGVSLGRANSGPFAQFQNCDGEVGSIAKLVTQLVQRLPNASPNQDLVQQQVEVFKAAIDPVLAQASEVEGTDDAAEDSTAKLFEEIKVMFRDLPSRLEHIALVSDVEPRSRKRRVHPGMIEEAIHMVSRSPEPSPGMAALILSSYVREELPWFYEMGVSVYEASLSGSKARERRALQNFIRASEIAFHGPLSEDFRMRDSFQRDIPMMVDMFLGRYFNSLEPEPDK